MRQIFFLLPAFFVFITASVANFPVASGSSVTSPLSVEIQPVKITFRGAEPIQGQVLIFNPFPGNLSGVFNVTVYHNDNRKYTLTTALEDIFTGKNIYDFEDFGIPQFNTGPEAAGFWRIEILQQNLDEKFMSFTVMNIEYPEQDRDAGNEDVHKKAVEEKS